MYKSPQEEFNTSSQESRPRIERYYPRISEQQLAYLDTIGGHFRGFVENSGTGRYEDVWHDVKAVYAPSSSKLTRASVETRAYGSDTLQGEDQIEGYAISIKFDADDDGITQTLDFDIRAATVQVPNQQLHALADTIHHYIVHDLNSLPRNRDRVEKEIDLVIHRWKLESGYESGDPPSDIHDPGSED
jgi:hypothetical protein